MANSRDYRIAGQQAPHLPRRPLLFAGWRSNALRVQLGRNGAKAARPFGLYLAHHGQHGVRSGYV
jgi:hypothetical protein